MARRRSNTVGNKLKDQDIQQEKASQHAPVVEQPHFVKMIMRRTNKPSRLMDMPSVVTGDKLFESVQKQFYIAEDKQVLFYKGRRIESSRQNKKQSFTLTDKSILHVHNKDNITRDSINVYLQFLNTDYIKYSQVKITAHPNQIILNTLEDALMYQIQDIQKYVYEQSGRFINLMNSYENEGVQDDSVIVVMVVKNRGSALAKMEEREIQIVEARSKNTKITSLHLLEDVDSPDFKKKDQLHVYRSMIMPQSKELIWEEDTSSELSKKTLLKKIIRKRHKKVDIASKKSQDMQPQTQIYSNRSEYSSGDHSIDLDDKQMPMLHIKRRQSQKQSLFRKLFQSEKLPKRVQKIQVKNLKPPAISTDFFEEVDELDFGEDEMQIPDNDNLKMSAPLASFGSMSDRLQSSVGKLKGMFIPVMTFDGKDDDDDDDI